MKSVHAFYVSQLSQQACRPYTTSYVVIIFALWWLSIILSNDIPAKWKVLLWDSQ